MTKLPISLSGSPNSSPTLDSLVPSGFTPKNGKKSEESLLPKNPVQREKADLPVRKRDEVKDRAKCPRCGRDSCPRHSRGTRLVHEIAWITEVAYSKHWCANCRRHFSYRDPDFIGKRTPYSNEYKALAVGAVFQGKSLAFVSQKLGVPQTTLSDWVRYVRTEEMRQLPLDA